MDGKDVVAMARTGSGKTAAFLVPMFEKLKAHSVKVMRHCSFPSSSPTLCDCCFLPIQIGARALILSPTRELATQTMKFTKEVCYSISMCTYDCSGALYTL